MSQKRYRKGKQIVSIAEFEQSKSEWFVVKYGAREKTTHIGWIISWQYRMLKNLIEAGRLYEAKEEGHDEDARS